MMSLAFVLLSVLTATVSSYAYDFNQFPTPYVTRLSPVLANAAAAKRIRGGLAPIKADLDVSNANKFKPDDPSLNSAVNSTVQSSDFTLSTYGLSTALAASGTAANLPTNVDPVWSPDQTFIIFASNRKSVADPTPTLLYHLYSIDAQGDASSLTLLTPMSQILYSQRYPAFEGTSTGGSASQIVFAQSTTATGDYYLYSGTLTLATVTTGGYSPINAVSQIPTPFGTLNDNLTVQHPSLNGSLVVFAGAPAGGLAARHLFAVSLSGNGAVTELTYDTLGNGTSELDPALDPSGNFIAFDSSSPGWTQNASNQFTSAGLATNRGIFVMNLSGTRWSQLTVPTSTTANISITPCWSLGATNTFLNPDGLHEYIYFSRQLTGTTFHVYYLRADESGDDATDPVVTYGVHYKAIVSNEGQNFTTQVGNDNFGTNTAVEIDSSDPVDTNPFFSESQYPATIGAVSSPAEYNHFQPSVSTLATYPMVVYASDRYLSNNPWDNPYNGIVRYAGNPAAPTDTHIDNGPDNFATTASAFPAGSEIPASTTTTTNESNNLELSVSRLFTTDAPGLLRYDESTSEILRIESYDSQGTASKYIVPGSKVNVVARLTDRESGVGSVWVQMKDPDSKYQDAGGLEHKVFTRGLFPIWDSTGKNDQRAIEGEIDESTIFAGLTEGAGAGLDQALANSALGGSAEAIQPASAYTVKLYTNNDYTSGSQLEEMKQDAAARTIVLTVVGTVFRPGDTMAIVYDGATGVSGPGSGGLVMQTLVVTVSYPPAGPNTVTIFDPLPIAIGGPGSKNTVVDLYQIYSRAFDWTGNEIDCQALNIANGIDAAGSGSITPSVITDNAVPTDIAQLTDLSTFDSTIPYNYATPRYAPGASDQDFWGTHPANPRNASNTNPGYWIPMYPLQSLVMGTSVNFNAIKGNSGSLTVNTVSGFQSGDICIITNGVTSDYVTVSGTPTYTPATSTAAGYGTITLHFSGSTTGATGNSYGPNSIIYEKHSVGGGVLYMTTITTPPTASDYYLDVIAYDNSQFPVPYDTGTGYSQNVGAANGVYDVAAVNWRIYDNVSGFTTATFSPSNQILVVNDHDLPQKFFEGRFGTITSSGKSANVPTKLWGAESYLTDIETCFNDQTYTTSAFLNYNDNIGTPQYKDGNGDVITMRPPANLPDYGVAFPYATNYSGLWPFVIPIEDSTNLQVGWSTSTSSAPYRNVANDNLFQPGYANGLGVNSYVDNDQSWANYEQMSRIYTVSRNAANGLAKYDANVYDDYVLAGNASPETDTQKYDLWRIMCRGAVPQTVLAAYAPTVVTQTVADPTAVGIITGSVTLPAPVTGLTINVTAGGVSTTAALNIAGTAYTYTLNNVPAGSIIVYAYATGYPYVDETVTVTSGQTTAAAALALVAGASNTPPAYSSGNNVVVANSCILWSSPYTGDEFVETGTLADGNTQAWLSSFLDNGGRLLVEGQDVGYSLTNNGTAPNTFYTNQRYLNAAFGSDTTIGNSGDFTLTTSNKPVDYISNDAFVNASTGNIGHGSYNRTAASVDFANFYFQSPSQSNTVTSLSTIISNAYMHEHGIAAPDGYADGSLNCYPFSYLPISYVDQFTAGPGAQVEIFGNQLNGQPGLPQLIFTGDPLANYLGNGVTNPAQAAICVYGSFGFETFSQYLQRGPGIRDWYETMNQRTFLLHNLVCMMRTGRFNGTVTTQTSGGQGIPGATVTATMFPATTSNTGINSNSVAYTALTDSNGNYEIDGLPPGQYSITALAKEGYLNTYKKSSTVYESVHGGDIRTFSFSIVQPIVTPTFSVVDDSSGTPQPINGAIITLYLSTDINATGGHDTPIYTSVTNYKGTASMTGVKPGTYIITVSSPNYQTYDSTGPGLTVPYYYTFLPTGFNLGTIQQPTSGEINAMKLTGWPVPIQLTPVIPMQFLLTDMTTLLPLLDSTNYSVAVVAVPPQTLTHDPKTGTDNGLTTIANLPAGTYSFTITATGYKTYTGSVAISSSGYQLNGSGTYNKEPIAIALSATKTSPLGAIYGLISCSSTWYWPDHGVVGIDAARSALGLTNSTTAPTYTLTNTVTDAVISGTVTSTTESAYPTSTGLAGIGNYNFAIDNVPTGTYTLSVSSADLRASASYTGSPGGLITVASPGTTNIDIALTPVYDKAGSPALKAIADPNYPTSSVNAYALQMLTLPYDFTDSLSLTDRFGGTFGITTLSSTSKNTAQKIAVYDGSTQGWLNPTGTSRGQAFWVRLQNPFSMPSPFVSASIAMQGTFTPMSLEPSPTSIPIYAGWNMLGNPWELPVFAEHITVVDSGGNSETWGAAVSSGIQLLSPTIYFFNPGDWSYVSTTLDTTGTDPVGGGLNPFIGYWVYAYGPCTLQIPNPGS